MENSLQKMQVLIDLFQFEQMGLAYKAKGFIF